MDGAGELPRRLGVAYLQSRPGGNEPPPQLVGGGVEGEAGDAGHRPRLSRAAPVEQECAVDHPGLGFGGAAAAQLAELLPGLLDICVPAQRAQAIHLRRHVRSVSGHPPVGAQLGQGPAPPLQPVGAEAQQLPHRRRPGGQLFGLGQLAEGRFEILASAGVYPFGDDLENGGPAVLAGRQADLLPHPTGKVVGPRPGGQRLAVGFAARSAPRSAGRTAARSAALSVMSAPGRRRAGSAGPELLPAWSAGGPPARAGALPAAGPASALSAAARTRAAGPLSGAGRPGLLTAAFPGPRRLPAFGAALRLGPPPRPTRRSGVSPARFLPARLPAAARVFGIPRVLGIWFLAVRGGHGQTPMLVVAADGVVLPWSFHSGRAGRRVAAGSPSFAPLRTTGRLHPADEAQPGSEGRPADDPGRGARPPPLPFVNNQGQRINR